MLSRLFALLLLATGLLLGATPALAQPNLVPNPSFEESTAVPRDISQLELARPWRSFATSGNEPAELFAAGAPARVGVPQNFNGTEPAHEGAAYAGFIPFSKMDDERYREFFVVPLTEPLEAGCTYRAGCFVSLAERAHWAADGVQMLFSARGPLLIEQGYAQAQPQVSAGRVITGSAARQALDRWSDIDLAFGIAEPARLREALADGFL